MRTRLSSLFAASLLLVTVLVLPAAAAGRVNVIVVFGDHVQNARANAVATAVQHDVDLEFVYEHALDGFSGSVPAGRLKGLENDPRVAYVEINREVSLSAQTTPTGVERIFADDNPNLAVGDGSDERVDVDVAVIDTGIDFQHPDLNVVGGVNCSGGGPFGGSCSSGGDDDHYHGTHVAGTVAAIDNGDGVVGVAPGARLHAVKVLNSRGSGYQSWIVAGIDWVAANADTIEVANMSLGGSGFSQAEYDAIQGAVDNGVAFAVAAGNDDDDANNYSPAAFDNALTVSALADFDGDAGGVGSPTCRADQDDTLADFSNWGDAVDIAAPGTCILSTFPLEQGEYGTISGTSMASPHAAGAMALLASSNNPDNATDVFSLYDSLIATGNLDWTDDSGDGIHEPLLDVSTFTATMVGGGGGDPTDEPPAVTITAPSDGATFTEGDTITFTGSASDTEDGDLSGSISWSSNLDGSLGTGDSITTTLSAGDHTVTASVSDSGGNAASDSITVSVTADGGGTSTMTVSALDGSSAVGPGPNWDATVTPTVTGDGSAVSGATVTGSWDDGTTASCTTGSGGTCQVTARFNRKKVAAATFTVTSVTATGFSWDGGTVTSVTVTAP